MAFSVFRSLNDLYTKFVPVPEKQQSIGPRLFVAEVVDVVLSKQHAKYRSEADIGKILYRELPLDYNIPDEDIKKEAYPMDTTDIRVPLPGEFIVGVRGLPGNYEEDVNIVGEDYYISVISNLRLLNYNGVPFGAILPNRVSKTLGVEGLSFIDQLKERHKNRFNTFIERQIKKLRPYDGDVIMQGRFGNSIRLGATVATSKTTNPYAAPAIKSSGGGGFFGNLANLTANLLIANNKVDKSTWSDEGVSGDPIIIMRTSKVDNIRYDFNKPEEFFTVEDINQDGSSLYLCENQKVSVQLQIANNGFKTWMKDLGIKPVANTTTVNDSVKQKPAGVEFSEDNDVSQNSTNQTQRVI